MDIEVKVPKFRKTTWTLEEDLALIRAVNIFGKNDWKKVALFVPLRNHKKCRERYNNQLDPEINKSQFTEEEDEKLLKLVEEYGRKWTEISKFIPGRTIQKLRNRYDALNKRPRKKETIDEPKGDPNIVEPQSLADFLFFTANDPDNIDF
jgi:hypothetical protein